MEKKTIREHVMTGLTAFGLIAVCMLLWVCFHNWGAFTEKVGKLVSILMPFIDGAILTFLAAPVYNGVKGFLLGRITEKKSGKIIYRYRGSIASILATLAALLAIIFVVTGVMMLIIPQLISSISNFWNSLPNYWENFYAWVQNLLQDHPQIRQEVLNFLQDFYQGVQSLGSGPPPEGANEFTALSMRITQMAGSKLTDIITQLSNGVFGVLVQFKNWLIGLIVMIYMLNMKETLVAQLCKLVYAIFPLHIANAIVEEARFVRRIFGGFLIGKIVDSIIIGILCFICLRLMDMPYPMLVSAIIGVTNVIPFFGPFIGAIPSAVLVLLVSPVKCVYFLLFILVLQQFDGNILGPRILGNSTGLSGLWVMFSILLFGGLFGVVGMIIGVPLWAVIMDLVKRAVHASLRKRKLPVGTEEYMMLDRVDEEKKIIHRAP